MANTYTAHGTAVWYGKARVICEADTDGMAELIAKAMNAYEVIRKGKS